MPCYKPLLAKFTMVNGKKSIKFVKTDKSLLYNSPVKRHDDDIWLPCGKCIGCKLERSRQWATRIVHESRSHECNCFLTLTYSDEHLPVDRGLHKRDLQLFFKRLRKHFGQFRYYACGEYGDLTGRPHYHVCLFGFDFAQVRRFYKMSSSNRLYTSDKLDQVWKFGHVIIGDLTFESAAYVARYVTKKLDSNDVRNSRYKYVDVKSGLVYDREREFSLMSRRPGIGRRYFDQHGSSVYSYDRVVVRGAPSKPPRYYDNLMSVKDPDIMLAVKSRRESRGLATNADSTFSRLSDREICKLKFLSEKQQSFI